MAIPDSRLYNRRMDARTTVTGWKFVFILIQIMLVVMVINRLENHLYFLDVKLQFRGQATPE